MTAPQTVYRVCYARDEIPHLGPVGTIARVLHGQRHLGLLGTWFPVWLVRFVGTTRDRWVLRLRGRWVLFEEGDPSKRY